MGGDQEDLVPRDEEKENQGIESQSTTPLILPLECECATDEQVLFHRLTPRSRLRVATDSCFAGLSAEPTGKECTEDGDNMAQ